MSRESNTGNLGTAEWLISTARSNPEGLLLLAAGCALLMRRGGSRGTSSFGHAFGHAEESRGNNGRRNVQSTSTRGGAHQAETGESTPAAAEAAREYVSEIGEKVAATASSYASSASTYADEARRNVSETSGRLARQAQSTVQETVSRVAQEQPLTLALLGFAAGAAVAAAFRTTEIENRTLGPAGEQLTDTAERAGERLKESTAEAGKRLRTAAEERGLDADGLKEVASEVAGAFGNTLSGEQASESARAPSVSSSGRSAQGGMPQSGGTGRSGGKSAKLDQSPQSGASRPSKSGRSSGKRGS